MLEKNTKHGMKVTFKKAKLETLLNNEIRRWEIEPAKITRNQQRYYLRLGNKQEGHSKNVVEQLDARISKSPQHDNIKSMQKRLHQLLSDWNTDNSSDNDASEDENDVKANDNSDSGRERQSNIRWYWD